MFRLVESLFGKEHITFGRVARVTDENLRLALDQAGVRVATTRVGEMIELLVRINPNTLVCDTCGEFPLAHTGGVSEITNAGNACPNPNCCGGHVEIVPIKLRMLVWTDGALVSPETRRDFRTIPGETLELQDEDILAALGGRMDGQLQTAMEDIGLPIYGLLAYMRLAHKRIHGDADVRQLLQHPNEFGLDDERLDAVLEEAKEFLDSREVTNLPPKPAKKKEEKKSSGKGGKIIGGQWRVLEKLGEGRLGTTYLVEFIELGTLDCAKHCYLVTRENIEALRREARAMWDLGHSALPVVRHFLTLEDGSALIIMKYFPGPTLRQVLDKVGTLDAYNASWIAERMIQALGYLQAHGKVHGDVRPEHIILTDIDHHQIGLVGFSLAKAETGVVSLGYSDKYAPPEQVNGEPLVPQSDLFALGRTIIEMMAGPTGLDSRTIPDGILPLSLRRFIRQMVSPDIAERPDWPEEDSEENPIETLRKIRVTEFGDGKSQIQIKPFPSF